MARLNWTDQAIDDLNKIAAYIAIDSPTYAEIHIGRLRERARQLVAASGSGRIVPELEREENSRTYCRKSPNYISSSQS